MSIPDSSALQKLRETLDRTLASLNGMTGGHAESLAASVSPNGGDPSAARIVHEVGRLDVLLEALNREVVTIMQGDDDDAGKRAEAERLLAVAAQCRQVLENVRTSGPYPAIDGGRANPAS